jgi:putative toxin-antitoxin system antitoxin component (TIGR02293 family)
MLDVQMHIALENTMSSTTTASPLQSLWSMILSRVGSAPVDDDGHNVVLGGNVGEGVAVKKDAKVAKGIIKTFHVNPPRKKQGRRPSAVEIFTIPDHLSAKQAYGIVKMGIPSRSLEPLSDHLRIGKSAVAGVLGMDRATATRKVAKDEVLPTYAAESMLRVLELDAMARDVFETEDEAAAWLQQPHPMLDGETPLDCAKSGFGAERVKDILNAIKYGGVV